MRRDDSTVESIASALMAKLKKLAIEQEPDDPCDETITSQSVTWEEYCNYFESKVNSRSSSISSLVDEITAL